MRNLFNVAGIETIKQAAPSCHKPTKPDLEEATAARQRRATHSPNARGALVRAGDWARPQHLCRSLLRRRCVAAAQSPARTHTAQQKLNCYNSLDMRMRLVITQLKVLKAKGKNILHVRIDLHRGQRERRARQLLFHLFHVVGIQVAVTAGPDEFARLKAAYLRQHHGQQGVAGNVEGHAEKDVRRTLIQLATELAVRYIELEQRMAGRQRHVINQRRVPGGDNQAA